LSASINWAKPTGKEHKKGAKTTTKFAHNFQIKKGAKIGKERRFQRDFMQGF
jgi:hypothetical protein